MMEYLYGHIEPYMMNCVLYFNKNFINSCIQGINSFSIECFGHDYRFPREPYWSILTALDGKATLAEILQNQKIKIMGRTKDSYLKHKGVLKKIKVVKFIALTVFFIIQVFTVPRWKRGQKIDFALEDSGIPKVSNYISFPVELIALTTIL